MLIFTVVWLAGLAWLLYLIYVAPENENLEDDVAPGQSRPGEQKRQRPDPEHIEKQAEQNERYAQRPIAPRSLVPI